MSYKLQFPYSEEERINFIVEHNHNSGRAIYTVDNYVEIEYDVIDTVEKEDGETVEEVVGKEIKLENRPTYYALEKNEIWDEENEQPIIDPEYEEKQKAKERERIGQLNMTRGDFIEGLILAQGKDEKDIIALIEALPINEIEKKVYINRVKNALDFYRGYPVIDVLCGYLDVSLENMDKFFETKDYTYLKGEN
jgi:hypothetical protein